MLFIFTVLHKATCSNVCFELRSTSEIVIHSVGLIVLLWPTCVCCDDIENMLRMFTHKKLHIFNISVTFLHKKEL